MRPFLVSLLVLSLFLAGCMSDRPEAAEPPEGGGSQGVPATGRETSQETGAQTAPAPEWQAGDWWRWQVVPRDAEAYEATTAVASVAQDAFQIGWGTVDEGLRSQFFHFIPHGPVARDDLSWEAHHATVDWFDFPLQHGKTWTGGIWMTDLRFVANASEVQTPDGPAAGFRVTGEGADGGVRVVLGWATDLQTITTLEFYLFDEVPWLTLTLLEQGAGRTEAVQLLHSEMAFATFTSLGQSVDTTTAPPAAQVIDIPAGTTHVALGCYLGGPPGYYAYRLSDAAGTEYGCDVVASSEWSGLLLDHGPVVPGQGTSSFVTVGEGSVFAELFFVRADAVVPA